MPFSLWLNALHCRLILPRRTRTSIKYIWEFIRVINFSLEMVIIKIWNKHWILFSSICSNLSSGTYIWPFQTYLFFHEKNRPSVHNSSLYIFLITMVIYAYKFSINLFCIGNFPCLCTCIAYVKLIFTSKTFSFFKTNNISIGLFLITLDFIIGSLYLLMFLIIHGMWEIILINMSFIVWINHTSIQKCFVDINKGFILQIYLQKEHSFYLNWSNSLRKLKLLPF